MCFCTGASLGFGTFGWSRGSGRPSERVRAGSCDVLGEEDGEV